MPLLHVGPNLIQDEGDDVGLYSQEQDITVPHSILIASGQIHTHPLQEKVTLSIELGNMAEPCHHRTTNPLCQRSILCLQGSVTTPK